MRLLVGAVLDLNSPLTHSSFIFLNMGVQGVILCGKKILSSKNQEAKEENPCNKTHWATVTRQ